MIRFDALPKIEECVERRVYKIRSRNLNFGVWNGKNGFIGIRLKCNTEFLFTEYHYDTGAPYGTVCDAKDLGVDVPNDIPLVTYLDSKDTITGRLVAFDKPITEGGKGWYFLDTGEADDNIRSMAQMNKPLFNFLKGIGKEFKGKC